LKSFIAIGPVMVIGLTASAGCAPLEAVELDRCGNEVLDVGEDCDTYATAAGAICASAGKAHECRYVCSTAGERAECPAGWRCGVDGVCRQPSGALGSPEGIAQPGGRWVELADMDGDAQADLVALDPDRATVAYLDDGELRQTFEIPLPSFGQAPHIGEATGDGLLDLLVPTNDGLATLRGSTARELVPISYASIPLTMFEGNAGIFTIDLMPDTVLSDGVNYALPGEEYLAFFSGGLLGFAEHWAAQLPIPLDVTKFSAPAVGDFDELTTSPLLPPGSKTPEEFVIAETGADSVTLYRPIPVPNPVMNPKLLALLDAVPPTVVSLGGLTMGERSIAVHLNPPASPGGDSAVPCPALPSGFAPGDEHLDLLIDVTGAATHTVAAYGKGDGHFHSDPCTLVAVPADDTAAPQPWLECTVPLLAAGHLDDDAFVDVITSAGIWMSSLLVLPYYTCGPFLQPRVGTGVQDWTEARIGDFDANGLPDVIAADRQGGLDLWLTSPGTPPSLTTIATLAPVKHLTVADFDSNGAEDAAFVESFGALADETASVLFGEPFAAPSSPKELTSAPEIVALARFDQRRFNQPVPDSANELVLVMRNQEEMRAAILWGRSDRQIYAPLLLGFANSDPQLPIAAAVGRIEVDGDAATAERGLFAAGIGNQMGLVALGGGIIAGENQIDLLNDAAMVTQAPGDIGAFALAADLDDSLTQAPLFTVWQQPHRVDLADVERAVRVYAPTVGAGAWVPHDPLVLPGVVPIGATRDLSFAEGDPIAEWTRRLTPHLRICALDAGGLSSLAFVAIEPLPCSGNVTGSTTALYLLGGELVSSISAGQSSPDSAIIVHPPEGEMLFDFACYQADADETQEIVLLTISPRVSLCEQIEGPRTARIYVTERDGEGLAPLKLITTLDESDLPELRSAIAGGLPMTGMTTGDTDGDGVDDVVIATDSRKLLLRGVAVNP
jgi:hypothetical protein